MKVEQLYTGCLSEAAYYIESNGEVAIIDPLRDIEVYIEMAKKDGAKIKWIIETHFHADFVSGHVDLAKRTGAKIVYGPTATAGFDFHSAKDNEILPLGNVKIKVLHTPGHTMESSCFLLIDKNGKDHALFSGDTLFLGDVGRPDLAIKSDVTRADLAGMLYDSLRNKVMTLADDVIVYPNHGAGSSCGKNMSKETVGSIGDQKKTNYALRADMTKAEFIQEVTDGLVAPPQYFPKNAMMNKMGYDSIDNVRAKGLVALTPSEFEDKMNNVKDAIVIDTRGKDDFAAFHVPKSLYFGIDGSFATWVGTLVENIKAPILFVADEGREAEVVDRFARVGYDNPIGYLKGGIDAWKNAGKATSTIPQIEAKDFAELFNSGAHVDVLDVRKCSEYATEHVDGIEHFNLAHMTPETLKPLDGRKKYYLHCASGYRSLIAAALIKKYECDNVINVKGGFNELKKHVKLTSDSVEA